MPRYTYTYISLPTGYVNIHLITSDIILNFTPDMQLFTQIQYDNISENFALSFRYRWEYEPGQELFVSVGQSARDSGRAHLRPTIDSSDHPSGPHAIASEG